MRSRFTPRLGALVALGLAAVLTAAACAPTAPPATTTPTTAPASPTAVAAATPTPPGYYALPVQFSSAGSTASTGATLTAYLWNFGDGTATSPLPNPTHTYTKPGPYTVTLKVTDSAALNNTTTITVAQPSPSAAVTILPNPVTVTPAPAAGFTTIQNARVYWTGQAANTLIFVDICRKSINDPSGWNYAKDCSLLSQITPNGTASGSGSALLPVFRGENPDGDNGSGIFSCSAASDTVAAGVQKNTTCYVRVTNNLLGNKNDAQESAFTIAP